MIEKIYISEDKSLILNGNFNSLIKDKICYKFKKATLEMCSSLNGYNLVVKYEPIIQNNQYMMFEVNP